MSFSQQHVGHAPGRGSVELGTGREADLGQVASAFAVHQAADGLLERAVGVAALGHREPVAHVAGSGPGGVPQRHLGQHQAEQERDDADGRRVEEDRLQHLGVRVDDGSDHVGRLAVQQRRGCRVLGREAR